MAQYQAQQGRNYNGSAGAGSSGGHQFGPASSSVRDAAFNDIFGGAPPGAGRSHTMTSAPPPPPNDRAATMSSTTAQGYTQRAPPMRPGGQMNGGYPHPPPPHSGSGGYANGQQTSPQRRPLPPQNLPQPIRPDRTPYAQPQRVDQRGYPMQGQQQRAFTQGPYAPPGPALNTDAYRSQSLATNPRPPMYQPPGGNYNMSAANAFRQQPYLNHLAKTTAQGRVVPERTGNERTMSMSSYTRDAEYTQTMSGRVIPRPKRESGEISRSPAPSEASTSTATTLNGNHPDHLSSISQLNGRAPSNGSQNSRTMSMASTAVPPGSVATLDVQSPRPSITGTIRSDSGRTGTMVAQKKPSLVYGALLSNVATAFRERVPLTEKEKDGLQYSNAFSGYEAVELIAYIIRTSDRNLALLLGRSLDAQKFFHEVAYAHRLRDSPNEIYQFKETLTEDPPEVNGVFTLLTECYSPTCNRDNLCYSIACPRRLEQQQRLNMKLTPGLRREPSHSTLHDDLADDDDLLANEQKLWINTVSKEISDSVSERERKRQEVISEIMYTERDFVKDLEYLRDFWIKPLRTPELSPIPEHRREKFIRTVFGNCQDVHAVNARMAQALTRRQQQNPVVRNVGDIFLDFVGLFGPFVKYGANQLFGKFEFEREKSGNPAFARFVEETERLKESRKLELNGYLTKPTTRLARYPLLLENVRKFTAEDNPDFVDLVKAVEKIREVLTKVNEESGKAENHYNLMSLNSQLKWGSIPHMDLKLTEESRQLIFKSPMKKSPQAEQADVTAYLFDHAVLLVRVKMVNKREEVKVYRKPIPLELLQIREMDAVLGLNSGGAGGGTGGGGLGLKRPSSSMIPGVVTRATGTMTSMSTSSSTSSFKLSSSSTSNAATAAAAAFAAEQSGSWPITFKGLGKGGYEITLYTVNQILREKWLRCVYQQKERLFERHRRIFTMSRVFGGDGGFPGFGSVGGQGRINCVRPFDGGRKLIVGTDLGVWVEERRRGVVSGKEGGAGIKNGSGSGTQQQPVTTTPQTTTMTTTRPRKMLDCKFVTQLEVLEQHQILIVLSDKAVYTYPLEALDPEESPNAPSKKGKRICHANYINAGMCNGQTLVCCVKSSSLSSTVKVFEPMDIRVGRQKKSGLAKMLAQGQEVLRPYKEFYIPMESNSIHFLRSKLCVGGAKGFEIVSLETLETQSLLDQADTSLDFVARRENVVKPIYIERNTSEFLLCYNDFSFYVNKNGWRARGDWKILWEGRPEAFATWGEKYILAFEPEFIEVRQSDTGGLVCIQTHRNIRFLHQSTREILFAYEDENGEDVIASLDFWGRS